MTEKHVNHLSITMDGSRSWAKNLAWNPFYGHIRGAIQVKRLVFQMLKYGIPYLSLFTFSQDNWKRSQKEVKHLFSLFNLALKKFIPFFLANSVKVHTIGRKDRFSKSFLKTLDAISSLAIKKPKLQLILALDYSGQWDIEKAAQKASKDAFQKEFSHYLSTSAFPFPEILIRSAGHQRLSNYFLYQIAQTELFFIDKNWPDIKEKDIEECLKTYNIRKRNHGK